MTGLGLPRPINPRVLVERFYGEVWNRGDEGLARVILDQKFSFRGSLGVERTGIEEFLHYLRSVRAALADYRCGSSEMSTPSSGSSEPSAELRFESSALNDRNRQLNIQRQSAWPH